MKGWMLILACMWGGLSVASAIAGKHEAGIAAGVHATLFLIGSAIVGAIERIKK